MKIQVKDRPYLIPAFYQVLRDQAEDQKVATPVDLENHFNDIYKLFLRRLADFEMQTDADYKFENELASILSELFRIKRTLGETV